MPHLGLGQNLRLELPFGGRHHADAGVAVHIHEAQGAEAVEPDVGHPLDDLFLAVALDRLFELLDGLGTSRRAALFSASTNLQLGGDLLHQAAPGELGEFFQFGGFHLNSFEPPVSTDKG